MKYFLLLRLKQIFRIFLEIGILRSVILLILAGIAVFKLILFTEGNEVLIAVVSFISVLSIHFTRTDKKLLNSIFDEVFIIFSSEYLLLSIPSIVALFLAGDWLTLSALIIGLVALSFISNSNPVSFTASLNGNQLLSKLPVEWTSGLRKSWPGLIILYVLSVFFHSYSTAIPLLTIISAVIVCSFFNECEPYQMVDLYHCSPKLFLKLKYVQHLKLFFVIYSPLLVLFTFCFPSYWFVFPVVMVVCSILLILAINTKYASYQPNEELGMNSVIIIVSLCCFLIPFLSPIPFFLVIRNHRRGLKNLENYLYAFHS